MKGSFGVPVSRYLRPEEQVVPFRDRPELNALLSWCGTGDPVAVRLVTGDGGAGKTRLALRLCQEVKANGWQPLWVPSGREAEAMDAVRELGTPCVAVVDYAETRNGLAGLLSEVAAKADGPGLRVVMLARSTGEWWQRLVGNSEVRVSRLLAASPVQLGPLQAPGGQDEVFREALAAFARKLRADRPDATLVLSDPEPVVLVVHAAALLAVLNHALGRAGSHPASTADVLAELLAHEERYWVKSAAARGLDLDMAVLRLAVMAGSLIGADSEQTAAALMAHIPDLADSAAARGRAARWLHDLYPEANAEASKSREWIGPLRPGRVAEHLIITELSRLPELIPGLFTGLGKYRAARALAELTKAALSQPWAEDIVIGSALSAAQAALLAHTGKWEQLLPTIEAGISIYSQADPSPGLQDRFADLLDSKSLCLAVLGRWDEALATIEQTVTIRRQLAADRLDACLSRLADLLGKQSSVLAYLGRREEARVVADEAASIRSQFPHEEGPGMEQANMTAQWHAF